MYVCMVLWLNCIIVYLIVCMAVYVHIYVYFMPIGY